MKRLGVFLLPPGWDASPLQGYPQVLDTLLPIYTPGWRETSWELSVLPKSTTKCSWPGLKPGLLNPEMNSLRHTNHKATAVPLTYVNCLHFNALVQFFFFFASQILAIFFRNTCTMKWQNLLCFWWLTFWQCILATAGALKEYSHG